jgi:hypothetical protein
MIKKVVFGVLLILSFQSISPANAVTPGTSCAKAGSTFKQGNKLFTCIKLGAKLYWDNGVTKSSSKKDFVCNQENAGKISANGGKRCVMTDDLFQTSDGSYKKLFEFRILNEIPASTLCRHDQQYWSNQTWYDGVWKCGYYVEGEWSKWGWHKSASQFANAIRNQYVIGQNNSATSQNTTSNTPKIVCSPSTSQVRAYFGSTLIDGLNMSSYIFENLSNCNISISATARFLCADGKVLKETNAIMSTGTLPLAPKQKLAVTNGGASKYFPQALQQCYQMTGYYSNLVFFSNFSNPNPSVLVLTSQP